MWVVKELSKEYVCAMGFTHENKCGAYHNGRLMAVSSRETLEKTIALNIMQPSNSGQLPQARLEECVCS